MTAAEIVAALYAFSDLMDEVAVPSPSAVREELSFLVSRYGTAMIGTIADRLAAAGSTSHPELDGTEVVVSIDSHQSAARLDWCRRQVELTFGEGNARKTA